MAGLPVPMPAAPASTPPALGYSPGGVLPFGSLAAAAQSMADSRAQLTALAESSQSQPLILNLAAHIDAAWVDAREAKTVVEQEMLEALYARRGQYTADKLARIKAENQPPIYMMVASNKMRQLEALLRDVLVGTGAEKPWTLGPTPVPEMPPEVAMQIVQSLTMEIQQAMAMGFPPVIEAARARVRQMIDEVTPLLEEEARKRTERMEKKMEDQQIEGGFLQAFAQFLTDLSTFKTAFLCGPVTRRKPKLTWGQGGAMTVELANKLEWERVDPFDVYPARYARDVNDGALIIKRRMSRQNLNDLIGVDGYDEAAIRQVLDRFGDSGLREWLSIESQKAVAEGRQVSAQRESGMIDALQFFGSASGKMLLEWGMDATQVPDPAKEYPVEAWKIGPYVIRAVLNSDPLLRRNIYAVSYQMLPGTVWGNSPYDLCKDSQDMCNAAARALAANMGIASGPQVGIISDRIPAGEDVTAMYPWKLWQFLSDPMGSTAKPIDFFQPTSNAAELRGVYEFFSIQADEATGIPRYMAGFNGGEGGAGRTASGISMMIGNASKIIKHAVGNIDTNIIIPMLESQYYYNMRYGDDPDLKGDINPLARGAMSVATKDAAQVRMNEFLQIALNSPIVAQIVGAEGIAELLRPTVKRLDVNPDKVVPSLPVLRQRMAQQAAMQMAMMQQQAAQGQDQGNPQDGGSPKKQRPGERLQDGTRTTDNFSPRSKQ